jgi:hypothetical protein
LNAVKGKNMGLYFIGIIGMYSIYEAEIQIITQPLDARFQDRIININENGVIAEL